MSKKNYVLDTNILISNPYSLFGFEDNNIYITTVTMQELDSKKTAPGEVGWGAREAIRILEECRTTGDLSTNGISLKKVSEKLPTASKQYIPADISSKLYILDGMESIYEVLPKTFKDSPDNQIIARTVKFKLYKESQSKEKVILVTNDASMRINASLVKLEAQEYKNDSIKDDSHYTGMTELYVPAEAINKIYLDKTLNLSDYMPTENIPKLYENEFLIMKSSSNPDNTALGIYNKALNIASLITTKKVYGVTPKNAAQVFALYALTAPASEIPLVILKGAAGSAKTFLSLAAGLDSIDINGRGNRSLYNKVLITRNNVTSDDDFGYLPGDIDEKMTPLLAPFYDNLESLVRGSSDESNEQVQMQINDFFDSGMIKVCPLAYMRGRSITHSYLIVDEAQNSTRLQMRDIITRAGEGTKVVICGDPKQIDNIRLDRYNNGLVFAADKMKDSPLCAQITFGEHESVRSSLASEALRRLEI